MVLRQFVYDRVVQDVADLPRQSRGVNMNRFHGFVVPESGSTWQWYSRFDRARSAVRRLLERDGCVPTAEDALSLVAAGLRDGTGYLSNRDGSVPAVELAEAGYADRLHDVGWGRSPGVVSEVWSPPGVCCGAVVGEDVWFSPAATHHVAGMVAARGSAPFIETVRSLAASWLSSGIIRPGGSGSATSSQRLQGSTRGVWMVPLAVLLDATVPEVSAAESEAGVVRAVYEAAHEVRFSERQLRDMFTLYIRPRQDLSQMETTSNLAHRRWRCVPAPDPLDVRARARARR